MNTASTCQAVGRSQAGPPQQRLQGSAGRRVQPSASQCLEGVHGGDGWPIGTPHRSFLSPARAQRTVLVKLIDRREVWQHSQHLEHFGPVSGLVGQRAALQVEAVQARELFERLELLHVGDAIACRGRKAGFLPARRAPATLATPAQAAPINLFRKPRLSKSDRAIDRRSMIAPGVVAPVPSEGALPAASSSHSHQALALARLTRQVQPSQAGEAHQPREGRAGECVVIHNKVCQLRPAGEAVPL